MHGVCGDTLLTVVETHRCLWRHCMVFVETHCIDSGDTLHGVCVDSGDTLHGVCGDTLHGVCVDSGDTLHGVCLWRCLC